MALTLFKEDVVFLQRFLGCCGLYGGRLSGTWSAETDAAVTTFEGESMRIAEKLTRFDARSERNITTLQPNAQRAAREFLACVRAVGIDARILSGTRTYAEQNMLYGKGRYGNTEKRVTNAKGGHSNHNFGIAWDVGIFEKGAYLGNKLGPYRKAAQLGLVPGLEWGGDWVSFPDLPHYQLATGQTLAATRISFESGAACV